MPRELTTEQLERIANAPMALRQDSPLMTQIIALDVFEEPPELAAEIVAAAPPADEAKIPRLPRTEKAVAVVPVYGGIAQHRGSDYWGGTFTEELTDLLGRLVGSANVGAVVLSFDSPGGIVYGVQEAAEAIREMSQTKPVIGHVKGEAASAAYWLASATTKLFAQPSSAVGSIGVWALHLDVTGMLEQMGVKATMIRAGRFKAETAPWLELTDEAKQNMQEAVDGYYRAFLQGVANGRGSTPTAVKESYGEGRMYDAATAKSLGMVDGIHTMGEVLAGLMKPGEQGKRRSMASKIAIADSWHPELF